MTSVKVDEMSDQENGSPEIYYVDEDVNVVFALACPRRMAVFTLDDSDSDSGEKLFNFMTRLLGDD
ncbi:MAG: hypothetical protein NW237_03580 [Cyanobacteriota bacterium]|nr:hypothetical protein [Cyanobacteriota bacterium]